MEIHLRASIAIFRHITSLVIDKIQLIYKIFFSGYFNLLKPYRHIFHLVLYSNRYQNSN